MLSDQQIYFIGYEIIEWWNTDLTSTTPIVSSQKGITGSAMTKYGGKNAIFEP